MDLFLTSDSRFSCSTENIMFIHFFKFWIDSTKCTRSDLIQFKNVEHKFQFSSIDSKSFGDRIDLIGPIFYPASSRLLRIVTQCGSSQKNLNLCSIFGVENNLYCTNSVIFRMLKPSKKSNSNSSIRQNRQNFLAKHF